MRRTILSALALVLTLGLAAQAAAAEKSYSLAGTSWTSKGKTNDGIEVTERADFDYSGNFSIVSRNSAGVVVNEYRGNYEVQGETLVLKIQGKEFRIKIVSMDLTTLLMHHDQVGEMKYTRAF